MRSMTFAILLTLGCGNKERVSGTETPERPRSGSSDNDAKRESRPAAAERKEGGEQNEKVSEPKEGGAEKERAEGAESGGSKPDDDELVELKSKESAELAGLEVEKAAERPEGAGVVVTASIAFDATKRAIINARAPGIVRTIKVDVGTKVQPGTALAVIESAQVGADRSRIAGARSRVQVAEATYKRESELQSKGISATKDLLAAQQEFDTARSDLASLNASLGAVGQSAGGGGYSLASPSAGVVVQRVATIGKLVGVEETLFEVVDTSTMWADIDVPEDQLVAILVGQPVVVVVDGLGDREFRGVISYVAPQIDPKTRTARARAALPNPDGMLRANMFARARVVTNSGKPAVTIASRAVQRIGDDSVVFVRKSPVKYEIRHVELGANDGATVEVTSGLRGGEEVVTQGAFLLKSEMLKGSLKGDDD